MRLRFVCAIIACSLSPVAAAETAVVADSFAPSMFSLGLQFTAGWRFTVNAPLTVTHLGLYDHGADGFEINYPIALWNAGGSMLAETTMPAGAEVDYIDGFRYVELDSLKRVTLQPGETYTVGYFQSTLASTDLALHFNGFHQMHPLINQIGGGFVSDENPPFITMPNAPFIDFTQWLGPSFQFTVVPGPASWLALGVFGLRASRRRW